MPKFVIEREIPGIGSMSQEELCGAAVKSNDAITALTPRVQWQESYVTTDKVYCVFIADDEEAVAEHASLSVVSRAPCESRRDRARSDHCRGLNSKPWKVWSSARATRSLRVFLPDVIPAALSPSGLPARDDGAMAPAFAT